MFEITLKNNKIFFCDSETTIFNAAQKAGIILEHSCLNARCSSCIVKIISGETKNKYMQFSRKTCTGHFWSFLHNNNNKK